MICKQTTKKLRRRETSDERAAGRKHARKTGAGILERGENGDGGVKQREREEDE